QEQHLYARYQEVYAGMVTTIDRSLNQIRQALSELGEWDNTLVIFTSDNGASKEGGQRGTSSYFQLLQGPNRAHDERALEEDAELIEHMGDPTTQPHYPRGWAMVSNTPFRLYKIN